ncbi:MAG: DNA internalization-related competence protein ComEC/Rec2, partial [bacterium]
MSKLLVIVSIAYIIGIIISSAFNLPFAQVGILCLFVFLWSVFSLKNKKLHTGLALLYFAAVLAGSSHYAYRSNSVSKNIGTFLNTNDEVLIDGTIHSDIEFLPSGMTFALESESIEDNSGVHIVKSKIKVNYISRDQAGLDINYNDRVKVKGRLYFPGEVTVPGVFDYGMYLRNKGFASIVSVRDSESITKIGYEKGLSSFFARSIISIRRSFQKFISESVSEEQASLLSGILLGMRKNISAGIQDAFSNSGMMHVLAVSGLHVGLVGAFCFMLLKRLYVPHKIGAAVAIVLVFVYAFVTGGRPSAMRAALMVAFGLSAFILERDKNFYHSLALACLVILVLNPMNLFDVGFQLSFVATLSILYFTPKITEILKFKPRWLAGTIGVTVAAYIGVMPITAYYFNKVSLIGLVANILVVPLVGIIVGTGFVSFLLSLLSSFLLPVSGFVMGMLADALLFLIKFFSSLPYAFLHVSTPGILFLVSYYIFAIWLGQIKSFDMFKRYAGVLLVVLIGWSVYANVAGDDRLRVTFIDVGQGDAIFLEFPDKSNMLIDGGGSLNDSFRIGERVVVPFLWHRRVRRIDRLVLSHPHYNHLKGLLDVMEYFPVKEVFIGNSSYPSGDYRRFLRMIKDKEIPLMIVNSPVSYEIGNRIEWSILNPVGTSKVDDDADVDNNSIVSRFKYKDFSLLLTGDIREGVQIRLARENTGVSVLQIPRHGKNPLNQRFLLKIHPAYAIISSKLYGEHELHNFRNSAIYSTCNDGTIVVSSDGK